MMDYGWMYGMGFGYMTIWVVVVSVLFGFAFGLGFWLSKMALLGKEGSVKRRRADR